MCLELMPYVTVILREWIKGSIAGLTPDSQARIDAERSLRSDLSHWGMDLGGADSMINNL